MTMKFRNGIAAITATTGLLASTTLAFTPNSLSTSFQYQSSISTSPLSASAPCDIPTDVEETILTSQKGSGKILRSAVVTNAEGDYVPLDRPMGKGTSVVIFLRHMG
jgi:hypothetical protein